MKIKHSCGAEFNVPDRMAGRKTSCPSCGMEMEVLPAPAPAPAATAPAAPPSGARPAAAARAPQPPAAAGATRCGGCDAPMSPYAQVCGICGFDKRTGKRPESTRTLPPTSPTPADAHRSGRSGGLGPSIFHPVEMVLGAVGGVLGIWIARLIMPGAPMYALPGVEMGTIGEIIFGVILGAGGAFVMRLEIGGIGRVLVMLLALGGVFGYKSFCYWRIHGSSEAGVDRVELASKARTYYLSRMILAELLARRYEDMAPRAQAAKAKLESEWGPLCDALDARMRQGDTRERWEALQANVDSIAGGQAQVDLGSANRVQAQDILTDLERQGRGSGWPNGYDKVLRKSKP